MYSCTGSRISSLAKAAVKKNISWCDICQENLAEKRLKMLQL